MTAIVDAGYLYEIAGLVFYVFFLMMTRKRSGARYSQRTRILTIVAAISLVGVVPFHYAANRAIMAFILLLALAALGSAAREGRAQR